jgi:hypothetical protein
MKLTLHCDDNNRLGDLQESRLRVYELDVLFVRPCMNCRVSCVFFKVIRPLDDASLRQYVPDRCGPTLDCTQAWIITTATKRTLFTLGALRATQVNPAHPTRHMDRIKYAQSTYQNITSAPSHREGWVVRIVQGTDRSREVS